MKKILSILAAISFTASVGSTVVACGSSSTSSSNLKGGIDWSNDDAVLLTLADGTKVTVGQMLNKNSSSLDDYIMNYINGAVADRYTSQYSQNTLVGKNNLGFMDLGQTYKLQNPSTKNFGYNDEVDKYGMVSTSLDLYRQYVSTYITGSIKSLDQQYFRHGGHLNPVWYKTAPNGTDGNYSLWFQEKDGGAVKRWTTKSETNITKEEDATKYTDILDNKYLPTPDELNGNNFFLVDTSKAKFHTGWDADNKIDDKDKIDYDNIGALKANEGFTIVAPNISGQEALTLRYQDHLQSTSTDSMQNALVMEYAKNNLYKMQSMPKDGSASDLEKASDKSLYIDTSSTAARDIQSWPGANDNLVTSSYKMVWSLTVPKKQALAKAKDIQDTIAGQSGFANTQPYNDKLLSSDYALIKNDTPDAISKAMAALWALAKPDDASSKTNAFDNGGSTASTTDNLSKNGSDPYFGISGYQGIVKDGKSVDGGTLNINSSAVDKIKNVEGMGLLTNGKDAAGNTNYTFTNEEDKNNNVDFVFVMPIYLMDLLRSGKNIQPSINPDANELQNIALNQWIPLNPQTTDAKWNSGSGFELTVDGKKIDPFKGTTDDLPTSTSILTKNKVSYLFVPTQEAGKTISLKADGKDIAVTTEDAANAADPTKDQSAYGVSGIYETTDTTKKDAWKYNGQNVKYAIHLGIDNSAPDSYENSWGFQTFRGENVDDVANLSSSKKDDLMTTLFASIAKNDSSLQEEAKNAIYRNYIQLDDIKYKGIYDKISKYLKEDDNTDDSN